MKQVLEFFVDVKEVDVNYVLVFLLVYFGKQIILVVIDSFFSDVVKESLLFIVLYNFFVVCNGIDLDFVMIVCFVKQYDKIVGVKFICGVVVKIICFVVIFIFEEFIIYGG